MKNKNYGSRVIKIIIFSLPIAALIFFIIIKIYFSNFYISIIREDSVLENLQIILLLVCSILSILISKKYFKNKKYFLGFLYVVVFIFFVFWSFEEISWGQRIFEIETPKFMVDYNIQNEITIHNLRLLQGTYNYIHLAYLILSSLGLLSSFIFFKKRENPTLQFLYPDWHLSIYFLPCFTFYFYWEFLREPLGMEKDILFFKEDYFFTARDQEPAELFLIMGILLLLIIYRNRQSYFYNQSRYTVIPILNNSNQWYGNYTLKMVVFLKYNLFINPLKRKISQILKSFKNIDII